jgi:branched-subunit amino acid transport protein
VATTLIILGMALVTFGIRFSLIALLSRDIPLFLARWLRYIPVAIFTALIVPGLLAPQGEPRIGAELGAGLVGLLVAYRSRQVLPVILAGMGTYWLLRALGIS